MPLPSSNSWNDGLTSGIAVVALAEPVWDQWLKYASEVAGDTLPILGALWLAIQALSKIKETWFK